MFSCVLWLYKIGFSSRTCIPAVTETNCEKSRYISGCSVPWRRLELRNHRHIQLECQQKWWVTPSFKFKLNVILPYALTPLKHLFAALLPSKITSFSSHKNCISNLIIHLTEGSNHEVPHYVIFSILPFLSPS